MRKEGSFVTPARETTTSIDRCWQTGWTYDAFDAYVPFPRTSARIRVLTDLNRQTGRPCFVRARATAPTKSGIFPISRLLMRLDVKMSNPFYWMYTLAPTVPRHRLAEHRSVSSRQGNRLTRNFFSPLPFGFRHFFNRCTPSSMENLSLFSSLGSLEP